VVICEINTTLDKSVVFLAGAARSDMPMWMPMLARYLHGGA